MKKITQYFKLLLLIATITLCGNIKAQVNGFSITTAAAPNNLGTTFPLNVSFNWTPTTTSATVVINYNSALVSYDASCAASLPSCMVITNSGSQLTITMSSLSSCTNTGAISFNVCFKFNCPDSCTGVVKPSVFTGVLTDNLSTTQNSTCTANGILNNNVSLSHNFHSFNQLTAEVTYKVCFYNPDCFKIKNPSFTIALSPALGTITSVYGGAYTYTLSGSTITPNTTALNQWAYDCFYYVVKLPCNTGLGQTLTSNVTMKGVNCGVANSIIKGPVAASYLIPAVPAATPGISVYTSASATSFTYNIFNSGNTPLNLTATNFLPLVHLKNAPVSVSQSTTQPGLVGAVKYYNCTSTPNGPYALIGNGATDNNAPATNTTKFDHTINNLQPGQYAGITLYYDLTSSCSGPAGNPPYKDSLAISYNCAAPPVTCIPCGAGGNYNPVIVYNPQPNIVCVAQPSVPGCKNIGDTIDLCYTFLNNGDATLVGGIYNVQLPSWLQAITSSVVYTGFSPNPTIMPATNIKFNLPNIPVGTNTYKICFKAVVQSGAVGGPNGFYNTAYGGNLTYPQNYICYTSFNICAFAAIGIDKKVKGSLNGSFGTTGNGAPNTAVDYEITVRNTGTIAVDNLVVIDRIPAIGNLTILGSPASAPVSNQFNMQMLTAPININYTAQYTGTQNINTLWPATGTPSFAGAWSGAVANGGVKFTFNPTFTLAPGATYTYTFQTKIPAGTANGLIDCNTVGFIAKATTGAYTINPVESNPVCIEVVTPEVPPGGCCKDLLKKITTTQSVNNDVLTINATLTAGPGKLKKVTVSLVNFEVKHPKDCDFCVKNPKQFGNITNLNSPLPFNTVPANVPFTHLIQWKDSAGYNFTNGVPLNFSIPLPPRSPIACCCDTIEYCLRYTFTDTACVMCDTTICYKTYNGKDCKSNGGGHDDGNVCNCNWKPSFTYEGGKKDVPCGGSITLMKGNIPVSLNPGFSCTPASQNCTPSNLAVAITNNITGVTSVLTGPNYNFTFLQSGTYTYNLSGTCGGTTCDCRLTVIIP
jgi:uncharacterized repeat protein (TIGR01451 family)